MFVLIRWLHTARYQIIIITSWLIVFESWNADHILHTWYKKSMVNCRKYSMNRNCFLFNVELVSTLSRHGVMMTLHYGVWHLKWKISFALWGLNKVSHSLPCTCVFLDSHYIPKNIRCVGVKCHASRQIYLSCCSSHCCQRYLRGPNLIISVSAVALAPVCEWPSAIIMLTTK